MRRPPRVSAKKKSLLSGPFALARPKWNECLRPNEQGPTSIVERVILLSDFSKMMDENIKGTMVNVAADLESESHRGTRTPSPPCMSWLQRRKKKWEKGILTSFQKPKWPIRSRERLDLKILSHHWEQQTRMNMTKLVDPPKVQRESYCHSA